MPDSSAFTRMNDKELECLGTNIEERVLPRVPVAEFVPKESVTKGLSQKKRPSCTHFPLLVMLLC